MTRQDRGTIDVAGGEGGFALVVALLSLLAVSAIAAAGIFVSGSERRVSRNHRSAVEAREIARAGISEYLATNTEAVAWEVFVYGRDTARVEAERLVYVEPDNSVALIRLTARGVLVRGSGRPNAERTVSTVVVHDRGRVVPSGALASGGALNVSSGTVVINGHDACGGGGAGGGGDADSLEGGSLYGGDGEGGGDPAGSTAGVAVPPGEFSGPEGGIQGEPPIDDSRSGPALLRASGIDSAAWAGYENGTLVEPDYEVPPDSWPSGGTEAPVILVDSPFTLDGSHSGTGTIIATGDLTVQGSFEWEGLILAGGSITASGQRTIQGAVLSGLDVLHGGSPGTSDFGDTRTVQYNACKLRDASRRLFSNLVEEPGTWYEAM